MPSDVVAGAIDRLLAGEDLGRAGAAEVLDLVMSGEAGEIQAAGFLIALRAKGESSHELAGCVDVLRARATNVRAPNGPFIDTCGTGGGISTFNISTAAAFVAAGAGVCVAKHGNRSNTSNSGSADVLEALGAQIALSADAVATCLDEVGVGFMFAPNHHPAFAHIVPVRRALAVRTVFNLLGPLANPAGAPRQLIGVADLSAMERMADALCELGTARALLVRGREGLDELSVAGPSDVYEIEAGSVRHYIFDPASLGITLRSNDAIAGGTPAQNAAVIASVLAGAPGAARDIVVVNAGAAIWIAGVADDIAHGVSLAKASIDSGSAAARLEAFCRTTVRLAADGRDDANASPS
jgi:anthranilate phosphoribosyltransferase